MNEQSSLCTEQFDIEYVENMLNILLLLLYMEFSLNNKLILHHASSVRKRKKQNTYTLFANVCILFLSVFFLIYCILVSQQIVAMAKKK